MIDIYMKAFPPFIDLLIISHNNKVTCFIHVLYIITLRKLQRNYI